jgi:hypothetical protein
MCTLALLPAHRTALAVRLAEYDAEELSAPRLLDGLAGRCPER